MQPLGGDPKAASSLYAVGWGVLPGTPSLSLPEGRAWLLRQEELKELRELKELKTIVLPWKRNGATGNEAKAKTYVFNSFNSLNSFNSKLPFTPFTSLTSLTPPKCPRFLLL